MKSKLLFIAVFGVLFWSVGYSQDSIELTFSAGNNGLSLPLDSIFVKNLTRNDEVMLISPENSLTLIITGINENKSSQHSLFEVSEIFPNPAIGAGYFKVQIPEQGTVEIAVSDISGKEPHVYKSILQAGVHSFTIMPGKAPMYLISVEYHDILKSQRMIVFQPKTNGNCAIIYEGFSVPGPQIKNSKLYGELEFQPGDELLMVGYSGGVESGFADTPMESRAYYFEFATNMACPGLDSLLYEGQWYHTIQVFGQCWLKENLNLGVRIPGSQLQSNNGIIEKYCFGNSESMCDVCGGLYVWEELMQYSQQPRSRGICPEGWHIPTDAEMSILEGAADSYYEIGNPVWANIGTRGYDNGLHLKSETGWMQNGNGLDTYDVTIYSTGYWFDGGFSDLGENGCFYTSSTSESLPYYHAFSFGSNQSFRNLSTWVIGVPVRCLKDL